MKVWTLAFLTKGTEEPNADSFVIYKLLSKWEHMRLNSTFKILVCSQTLWYKQALSGFLGPVSLLTGIPQRKSFLVSWAKRLKYFKWSMKTSSDRDIPCYSKVPNKGRDETHSTLNKAKVAQGESSLRRGTETVLVNSTASPSLIVHHSLCWSTSCPQPCTNKSIYTACNGVK